MEFRRLSCIDGTTHLYRPPLVMEGDTIAFTDDSGRRHEVARSDVHEISVEAGGGAHPDDEEMAGIEPV